MRKTLMTLAALAAGVAATAAASALAANVKVTPIGLMDGEFCKFDRAMVFEDPNGTRILYEIGRASCRERV